MKSKILGLVAVGLLAGPMGLGLGQASATVIDRSVSATGAWDYVFFYFGGGALTIDIRGNGWSGGPTGFGLDDSYIVLLVDDGSPIGALTGTAIALNDDSSSTFSDGSTSSLDSYLSLPSLAATNYVLAVGHCCTSYSQARNNLYSYVHAPYLDYRVTFSPGVVVATVPEPGTLALLGLGLAGLGLSRRRLAA